MHESCCYVRINSNTSLIGISVLKLSLRENLSFKTRAGVLQLDLNKTSSCQYPLIICHIISLIIQVLFKPSINGSMDDRWLRDNDLSSTYHRLQKYLHAGLNYHLSAVRLYEINYVYT